MNHHESTHIYVLVLLLSAALHGGMLASGYMQEDAFITFRTAFNLADHGIYSFNLDEQYPGATSLFFGFFVALLRYMSGESTILIVSIINIFFSVSGGYLLFRAVSNSSFFSSLQDNFTSLSVVLLSATAGPALLKLSSSGMETA